ncbi:allatostatin double C isoform X2 [Leptinotarsa decemlineata]|uniref:allatostatin double C isoform X2 n=1 Tax=Leptinotarsa decemlineata TaxID=7539 RepID=UPI003D30B232
MLGKKGKEIIMNSVVHIFERIATGKLLIVPKKRTAMLVNKLMVALKEAMEEDVREETFRNPNRLDGFSSRSSKHYLMSDDDVRSMDLQRRGHGGMGQQKGKNYWRCYFNAVTCF